MQTTLWRNTFSRLFVWRKNTFFQYQAEEEKHLFYLLTIFSSLSVSLSLPPAAHTYTLFLARTHARTHVHFFLRIARSYRWPPHKSFCRGCWANQTQKIKLATLPILYQDIANDQSWMLLQYLDLSGKKSFLHSSSWSTIVNFNIYVSRGLPKNERTVKL